ISRGNAQCVNPETWRCRRCQPQCPVRPGDLRYVLRRVFLPVVSLTTLPFRSLEIILQLSLPSSSKVALVVVVVPLSASRLVEVRVRDFSSHVPSLSVVNPVEKNIQLR